MIRISSAKGKERRDYPRAAAKLDVRLRPINKGEDGQKSIVREVFKATTSDLGSGGLAILTKSPLKVGRYIELDLFLETDEKSVKALTRVVKVSQVKKKKSIFYKVGLQILAVHDENAKKIAGFLSKSLKTNK